MEKFKNLIAWQRAHQLVLKIYKITKKFPNEEKFILVPQITRAAISIAANLAEGTKRKSNKDQRHFFNIAETSLEEVKYYIILAQDLNYISHSEHDELINNAQEVGRIITGLLKSVK